MAAKKRGRGNRSGFSIVVEDNRLKQVQKQFHEALGETADDIAFAAEYYAVTEHTYNNQTGNLEGNTYGQTTSTDSGDGVAVEVGSYMFYTAYVEARKPFLEPALEKALIDVEGQLRDNVRKRIR